MKNKILRQFEYFISKELLKAWNLHFDFNAIDIDGFYFEIYSDCRNVTHFILLVDVTK